MATRGLLLAGTDTAVGKTAVAQALLRLARRHHFALAPFKPVETGYTPGAADAEKLLAAGPALGFHVEQICPYRYAPPVAPAVAARLTGRPVSPEVLKHSAFGLEAHADALLVESAGGLLTPYTDDLTSADLSLLFGLDILLVAPNRLGTINHTALALAFIEQRHLPLAGLILVDVDGKPAPDRPHNALQITTLTGISALGILRFCPEPDADHLANAAAEDLDLRGLLKGRLTSQP